MTLPGGWELIIIVAVIIVVLGGSKAASSIKNAGREIYKAKKELDDIKDIVKK